MKSLFWENIQLPPRFLMPEKSLMSSERYFKLGFQITTLLTTFIISFLYIFVCQFINFNIGVIVCIAFVIIHAGLLYAIKFQKLNDTQVAHCFCFMTLIGLGAGSLTSGGPASPVNFWFVSTIVVSFWFADRKTALIWFLTSLLYLCLLNLSYFFGVDYTLYLNQDRFVFFKMIMAVGVLGYLSLVFLSINKWREITIAELKEINSRKDRMLALIGHDLKNPLVVIQMNAARIQSPELQNQNKVHIIERSVKKMNLIIENMMIYDQLKTQNYTSRTERIDLITVIQNLVEEFSHQAQAKNINIHCKLDDSKPIPLQIDSVALDRILTNLLSNALKYTPSHKNIFIEWTADEQLIIADEGEGFDQDQKEKLFGLYCKTTDQLLHLEDQSFGIGLYIVRTLCLQIDLKISLESPGRHMGSRFHLDLKKFLTQ